MYGYGYPQYGYGDGSGSNWIWIIIVVLIILLSASLLIERNNQTIFKDISISMEKEIMYPFTSLNKEKGNTQSESYLIQKNIIE